MKKRIFIFLIIILICGMSIACFGFFKKTQNLYPINDKNGGGYINKNGDVVIKQDYSFAFRFVKDYAIVQDKNQKYGIIDKQGRNVIESVYEDLDNLSEDFVTYKEGNKYGYIDIKNNKKYDAKFDKIKKLKEGRMAVLIGDKWGFINKFGEFVIEPKYYDVGNFSEGLASFAYSKDKTDGYINKRGDVIIPFDDNALVPREFHEGLAPIIKNKDKSCSYINKRGQVVIDKDKIYPVNIYCGDFREGVTVFYIDENPREITTGFINKHGKVEYSAVFSIPYEVSEGEFSAFDDFNSGMARFTLDYKTGYIDRKYKLAVPPIYDFGRNFEGDLAYLKYEDKEGYINKNGYWVWSKEREGM